MTQSKLKKPIPNTRKTHKAGAPEKARTKPAKPKRAPVDPAIETLARTIYGEARGELVRGQEAVAAVIMNRVGRAEERGVYWWGNTVIEVCRRPWQFSCWNENDPNRAKVESVGLDNRAFAPCLRIARRAANKVLKDPTGGATHYHVKGVRPPWAIGRKPSAEIGNHLFYNNVE